MSAVHVADLDGDGFGEIVVGQGALGTVWVFHGPHTGSKTWEDAQAIIGSAPQRFGVTLRHRDQTCVDAAGMAVGGCAPKSVLAVGQHFAIDPAASGIDHGAVLLFDGPW